MKETTEPTDNVEIPVEVKKKGKLKLIIIIIGVVLCLAVGGTYFFYGDKVIGMIFNKPVDGEEKTTEKKVEKKIGPIMSLEPFLFNIAGNMSKFAKVSIGIELKDAKVVEEAKKMTPVIRDKLLSILGSKTSDMLMDITGRDAIRQEAHNALKSFFKYPEDIKAVYITDIIIQ